MYVQQCFVHLHHFFIMTRLVLIYKTETDISRQCALDSDMKLVVEYAYTHWKPSVVMNLILYSKVHGVNMGPLGSYRPQLDPMLAPWTFLSGIVLALAVADVTLTRDNRDCHQLGRKVGIMRMTTFGFHCSHKRTGDKQRLVFIGTYRWVSARKT